MNQTSPFKKRLLILKQELGDRVVAIDKDIRHEGMTADWSEQAVERENDEVLESLGNASEIELAMVQKALDRIDAGEYFSCNRCGNDIPLARLELLPFSIHCVNCAEQLEK